jgi:branched-chain amino acid transport system substrate-binding protein
MSEGGTATPRLVLGAPVSLSGRYAFQGRLAAIGLRQAVEDFQARGGLDLDGERLSPEIKLVDDGSTRSGIRKALEAISGADLIFGPYGSDLAYEAALWAGETRRTIFNHGGSADQVQRLPGVISIPTPASRYLASMLEALADPLPGARVLLIVGGGQFGRSAAEGAEEAARKLGMTVVAAVPYSEVASAPDADVLLGAGKFAEDLELVAGLSVRPSAVGVVAAGLGLFGLRLRAGAEGILGPSQWEEGVRFHPDFGPNQMEVVRSLRAGTLATLRAEMVGGHVEYPAAQAYASVLVALRCFQDAGGGDDSSLEAAARRLKFTTFFGPFGLGEDGRQRDHGMVICQWHEGVKRIVWPPSQAETAIVL